MPPETNVPDSNQTLTENKKDAKQKNSKKTRPSSSLLENKNRTFPFAVFGAVAATSNHGALTAAAVGIEACASASASTTAVALTAETFV